MGAQVSSSRTFRNRAPPANIAHVRESDLGVDQPDDPLAIRRLRVELRERGGNLRGLARDIAAADDSTEDQKNVIEAWRRALYRYLGKERSLPEPEKAHLMAAALSRPTDWFDPERRQRAARPQELAEISQKLDLLVGEFTIGNPVDRLAALGNEVAAMRENLATILESHARALMGIQATLEQIDQRLSQQTAQQAPQADQAQEHGS